MTHHEASCTPIMGPADWVLSDRTGLNKRSTYLFQDRRRAGLLRLYTSVGTCCKLFHRPLSGLRRVILKRSVRWSICHRCHRTTSSVTTRDCLVHEALFCALWRQYVIDYLREHHDTRQGLNHRDVVVDQTWGTAPWVRVTTDNYSIHLPLQLSL